MTEPQTLILSEYDAIAASQTRSLHVAMIQSLLLTQHIVALGDASVDDHVGFFFVLFLFPEICVIRLFFLFQAENGVPNRAQGAPKLQPRVLHGPVANSRGGRLQSVSK